MFTTNISPISPSIHYSKQILKIQILLHLSWDGNSSQSPSSKSKTSSYSQFYHLICTWRFISSFVIVRNMVSIRLLSPQGKTARNYYETNKFREKKWMHVRTYDMSEIKRKNSKNKTCKKLTTGKPLLQNVIKTTH